MGSLTLQQDGSYSPLPRPIQVVGTQRRIAGLSKKPPVLNHATFPITHMFDGTRTACRKVIRFLGMAFRAELSPAVRAVKPMVFGIPKIRVKTRRSMHQVVKLQLRISERFVLRPLANLLISSQW